MTSPTATAEIEARIRHVSPAARAYERPMNWDEAEALLAALRAAEAERDEVLRLNAPDASPDDPAVCRLNVNNTVREWMAAGYRLHQRVGINAYIDELLARAEKAEAERDEARAALQSTSAKEGGAS